ncbi:MAG: hypothetical protein EXR69_12390 [Myxococcales bacterium]|nr:hypothetical protein [Myxococcales bacterium]
MSAEQRVVYTSAVASELGDLPGEPVGIGLCAALLGTAALIERLKPDLVLFVGTAGALPGTAQPTLAIGSVVQVGVALLGDAALALGLGYAPRHPGPLTTPLLPAIRGVAAITNLAITTDPALAALHAGHAQAEHMEAYGVALACDRAGVRWACVLGITNVVGPDAHAQWLANRAGCEAAARSAASEGARASVLPLNGLS